ncbi:MAG: 3-hydroxyacyl-CoA dehydrogenase [Pseudomonadota bacterium]
MKKVAVVGSGFIGRAWAIVFARGGQEVHLWDREEGAGGAAVGFIQDVLGDLERNDLLNGNAPDDILARLHVQDDLAAALSGAVHIQENTPEVLDIKRTVLAELDRMADGQAVIASSTSALLPSALAEGMKGRHRIVVAHPINPPYLVPAVEVVPSPWTSEDVLERTRAFLAECGQSPIVMRKEHDGFIMNRMQGALLEEAFRLVAEGYASIEDVDIGIREGLALRWSFMGPFETIDLNAPGGVADYAARYQGIYERIHPQMHHRVDWTGEVMQTVEADRRKALPEGELEERQKWRDRRLMALAAHKRQADEALGK